MRCRHQVALAGLKRRAERSPNSTLGGTRVGGFGVTIRREPGSESGLLRRHSSAKAGGQAGATERAQRPPGRVAVTDRWFPCLTPRDASGTTVRKSRHHRCRVWPVRDCPALTGGSGYGRRSLRESGRAGRVQGGLKKPTPGSTLRFASPRTAVASRRDGSRCRVSGSTGRYRLVRAGALTRLPFGIAVCPVQAASVPCVPKGREGECRTVRTR